VFEQIRALLAHGASDDDLYAAAALVFGDELVFYNHLWAGNRQVFFWTGYLKHHFYGEAEDYLEEYIRGFNNYAQAYRMFSSVAESAPPDIRERALFSMGRCLVALDEYAEEVYLAYSPAALRNEIIDLFSRFRDEYPSSQMADDALLTAGIYSQDTTFFETILEHYPKSDSAPEAKRRLKTAKSIRNSVTPVPFLLITDMQDLPLLVRERSESGEQVITHAGYAYVVEPLVEMGRVFSVWVDAVNHTITLFTDGNAGAGESTAVRFISPGAGFILRIDP